MKIEQAVMSCCYLSQSKTSNQILQTVIDEIGANMDQINQLPRYRDKLLKLHKKRKRTEKLFSAAGAIAMNELRDLDEFFINLPSTLYRPRQAAKFIQFIHGNPALTIVLNNNFEKLLPHPRKRQRILTTAEIGDIEQSLQMAQEESHL